MARNDPFEADLHGLEPEKLVLLMRSLNERAMGLNEEGKTKWRPKRVLVPWKVFIAEYGATFVSKPMIYHTQGIPHSCPVFCIRILKTKFVLPKDRPSKYRTIKLKSSLKRRRYRPKTCLM